ncbi:MAG: cell division protein FtsA [Anaerolineae bacterium]|nr:cell division protein FtsA [Anaerolineae bacterium]MCA9887802.1 cell division protein FtsA [Anaerolineae bacterium]MCA9892850.1 cell division protein FtsA [Anaerolineae bacterium]MCB9459113.1 cell division protein FtsA [Anaerolineaceae bacterium]
MSDIVVGLDIGTHKICTVVGEVRPDDIQILGVGIEPSKGMKKGVVNDVQALVAAISASVHKAEKTSGYQIRRAFVSVAGGHISSLTSRGMTGIAGSRGITEEDLEKAMDAARAIAIPHNREVLHIVPRSYTLDGQEGVRHPIGMHAFRLEVDAHIITASSTSLANLERAAEGAGILVDRFILNPLAAGEAVLSDEEREAGVVIIDIGGGTTDIAIFVEGTVWHTAVIPIGGTLITHDITYLLHAPFELAEDVKIQHGHAQRRAVSALEKFRVEPFGEGVPEEFTRKDLAMAIEARVEEIFELVQKEIKRSGYAGLLRAGAVITGGSAQLPGIQEVAQEMLDCPVRIAKPEKLTGMADTLKNPSYSTSIGLLRLGLNLDTVAEPRANGTSSAPGLDIGSVLGGFLRRLLPDDRQE